MKRTLQTLLFCMLLTNAAVAQDKIRTVFKKGIMSSGGYGAVTNKFTKLRGEYSNLSGIYGGWFINHRLMIGLAGFASTNNLPVPIQYSTDPGSNRSYEYGQFGLMTEYVVASHKPVHLVFQLFGGAGFTLQYDRNNWDRGHDNTINDENWFFVAEPGVQVEMNLFRWMRFSPGVSYRASFGSDAGGMKDKDIRGISYNATLKFGKF